MVEPWEQGYRLVLFVRVVQSICTVEPHLTDTPRQRTQWAILKVPTVLPFTSIPMQPLNSGHPATLYNGQFSWPNYTQTLLNNPN